MAAPQIVQSRGPTPQFGFRQGDAPLGAIMRGRPQRNNDDLMMMLFTLLAQQQGRQGDREESALDRAARQTQFEDNLKLQKAQFGESQATAEQQRDLTSELLRQSRFQENLGVGTAEFESALGDVRAERGREIEEAEFVFGEDFNRGKQVGRGPVRRLTRAFDALLTADEVTPGMVGKLEDALLSARGSLGTAVGAGSRLTETEGLSQGEFLGLTEDFGTVLNEIVQFGEGSDEQTRRRLASLLDTVRSQQGQLRSIGDRLPDRPALRAARGDFESQLSGVRRGQQTARRGARQAFEEGDVVSDITSQLGSQREQALEELLGLGTFAEQPGIEPDLSFDIFELLQGEPGGGSRFPTTNIGSLEADIADARERVSSIDTDVAQRAGEARQEVSLKRDLEAANRKAAERTALVQQMTAEGKTAEEIAEALRKLDRVQLAPFIGKF